MNPILQAILAHIEACKQISRLTVDKRHNPSKVIFEFADSTTAVLTINRDHQTFMGWWKHTGIYIRLMGLIKPLEELE